jgi:hypothetical protein
MKIPLPGQKLTPPNEPRMLTREEIEILREDLRAALTVPLASIDEFEEPDHQDTKP